MSKRMPKKVIIHNNVYPIKSVADLKQINSEGEEVGLYGSIKHTKRKIEIEKDMDERTRKAALIHEILHGFLFYSGHYDMDKFIEERFVQCSSHGIVNLMRQNPDLVAYIMDDSNE